MHFLKQNKMNTGREANNSCTAVIAKNEYLRFHTPSIEEILYYSKVFIHIHRFLFSFWVYLEKKLEKAMAPHSSTLAWKAAVHGVAEDPAWLSNFTFTFHFHALEKEMATHSSVLAWRIPGMGEPGGLLPMGSHRVGHDWSDLAAAAEKKQLFNGFILFHISKWLFILLWDYFINIKNYFWNLV